MEPQIPALRRYAYALLRDREAADDLVQDTLERAVAGWSRRRADGDLRAWLFAIERNVFLQGLRRRGRAGPHLGMDALDPIAAPGADPGGRARRSGCPLRAGRPAGGTTLRAAAHRGRGSVLRRGGRDPLGGLSQAVP